MDFFGVADPQTHAQEPIHIHTNAARIPMKRNVTNDATPTTAQILLTMREMMPMLGSAPE